MIAYVAKDLRSGDRLSANEHERLPAYSTIKVLLAAAFWRCVELGELDDAHQFEFEPVDSAGGSGVLRGFRHPANIALGDLAHLMLVVSDNDASNIIARLVGFERVNELGAELGLRQTVMARLMCDEQAVAAGRENHTSAEDLAALLEALATGTHVSRFACDAVWKSLEKQEHVDGIARYLPRDATYAGKCGDDSPTSRHAHDCALIREGDRRIVMAVMTRDAGGFEPVSRTGAALYRALRGA